MWPEYGLEMKQKLIDLNQSIPITFIYGGDSNFHNEGGCEIQKLRKNVLVIVIDGADHHVHCEKYKVFNKKIKDVLVEVDSGTDHNRKGDLFQEVKDDAAPENEPSSRSDSDVPEHVTKTDQPINNA